MKTKIQLRYGNKGVHRWTNSPYPELSQYHDHTFVILVSIEERKPREIEFIRFRRLLAEELRKSFGDKMWFFGDMSCEEIALWVIKKVREMLGDRDVTCTVWEDDEACAGSVTMKGSEPIESVSRQKRAVRQKDISHIV